MNPNNERDESARYPRRLLGRSPRGISRPEEKEDVLATLQRTQELEFGVSEREFVHRLEPGTVHLIAGTPGSGKTEFLRWVKDGDDTGGTPWLLIRMRDWARRPSEFRDHLREAILSNAGQRILLDGLDEARDLADPLREFTTAPGADQRDGATR